MNFDSIPDDLGAEIDGATFKRVFRKYLAVRLPKATPDDKWKELWKRFDREYPQASSRELAVKIVDWFIAHAQVQALLLEERNCPG